MRLGVPGGGSAELAGPGAQPGQVLDDRFLLVEEIARGGMSRILKARDLRNAGAAVVVKIPLEQFSSGVGSWSMFQQEEEIGLRLDHAYLLKFVPLIPRRAYVVTEYVPGCTLADRLARQSPLPEPEAIAIASRVCEALQHLHDRGFVHYDVKPANVMLCPDGTIRLIDFGLAHAAVKGRFSLSSPPPAIASAAYVAPEQVRRKRGRKSVDIYALGAMLYQMLSGQEPFPGDDPFVVASARTIGDPPAPRQLNPGISPQTEEIVLRALQRDPARRYPSAAAMRADLDAHEQLPIAGLAARLQPVTAWRRRLRLARYVCIVVVLPLAAQVGLFSFLWWYLGRGR
jgi:serine/threonine-protein kinase